MKSTLTTLLGLVLVLWLLPAPAAPAQSGDSAWQYPVIEGNGGVRPLPRAELQPDPHATYKVVFSVTKDKGEEHVNNGLFHVARAVNVFAMAGVPADHRRFVVVLHGMATWLAVDNATYKKHYGHDNPNRELIAKLAAAGVRLVACGQALAGMNVPAAHLDPHVHLSLSALSDLIVLQTEGYVLYPL